MKHSTISSAVTVCLALIAGAAHAQTSGSTTSGMAPDNTKTNKNAVDSSNKSSVADGQSNSSTDLALTQQIRKSVMADKTLSTYAHNVKIVSVNGVVTLNGVVHSDQEKNAVAMKAEEVAGKGKVTNDLKVAPPKS